jgi:predicted nuclease of predicted toxin-antitoxin system
MKIWTDAQLPPAIAPWIAREFGLEVRAVRELGLRDASDLEIFLRAKRENAVVMTKDSDFVELMRRLGTPPQVIWLTCGNTSNARL